MSYQYCNQRLNICLAAAALILIGCAPKIQKPVSLLPGKESATEAISILNSRSKYTTPIKANGRCHLLYYVEQKSHKENFPVKIWACPPANIYLQGNIAFDPRGLVAGSNEYEFWLAVSLKEVSSYWWGQWADETFPRQLMLSPKILLEALGFAQIDSIQNWALSNEGAFDILAKRNEQGMVVKKIYILNSKNYPIKKIEYFDNNGNAAIITKLDKYKQLNGDVSVPTFIIITNVDKNDKNDSVEIKLSSVKQTELTDKQRNRLFTRPQPQGFKHIYEIINGNIIEQPQ